jgi:hypothetical protein
MAQYAFNPITNRLDLTNTSSPGGDVVGPGSSTNNALVRWDGTTGTAIKNSNATLSDAGLLTLAVALPATSGGTGLSTYATGDVLYASAANTLSKLPAAVNGQVLTLAAGIPSWATPTTGTVTSVSGTANRITSTGGATPVIDISASYVGQTSITTLGTITTGAWNGSVIPLAYGGTNANLTANNGGIFYSTATAAAVLAGTATANQVLLSGSSTTPAWSTATYPATTTINQILYSSAANTVTGLATANSSVLSTNSSGVPSLTTTLSLVSSTLVMLTLENTDASAVGAPILELYRNSASPAANDTLGRIHFYGKDSGAAKQGYAIIQGGALSPTAGAENGALDFYATNAGADVLQMRLLNTGGQYRGNNTSTAPPAGFIGERLTALSGSVSISNATAKTIISLVLTPGNWLVQGFIQFNGTLTGTYCIADISATDNTLSDNFQQLPIVPTASSALRMNTYWRFVSIASNTTYYAVAQAGFTVGTATAVAQIDAIRIG